ncbi:MAG: hypothetical protein HY043_09780 [Verrucomicrobia bacterium]|nr:hypothetical protein [Verrucomicrobiota bacterium]
MSCQQTIHALYEDWRVLSETEGEAISAGDWERVNGCQDQKQHLQNRIIKATEALQNEAVAQGVNPKRTERGLRPIVERLIALELRNQELLSAKRQTADAEKAELERSERNLRQVHQSYGGTREAAWESYS